MALLSLRMTLPSLALSILSNSSSPCGGNCKFLTIGGDARCLDGSPFKIWLWPGSTAQWSIGIRGGGWCLNDEECLQRSKTDLGSSSAWTEDTAWPEYTCAGLENGCTKVFLGYCDGSAFSSHVAEASPDGLHFRGLANLDETLIELLNNHGLTSAKEVIVWGGSAGGLSTLLHLDRISATINRAAPQDVRVTGRPVAGYFLDYAPYPGASVQRYSDKVQHGYAMMNMGIGLAADCKAHFAGDEWKCWMAQYAVDFVKTAFFAANSRFDQFQLGKTIGIPCIDKQSYVPPYVASECTPAEQNAIVAFGHSWWADFQHAFQDTSLNRGFFVANCIQHNVACKVAGKGLNEVFTEWYNGGTGRWVDLCGTTPCNSDASCAPWSPAFEEV